VWTNQEIAVQRCGGYRMTDYSVWTDAELVRFAQGGNSKAFDQLVLRYQDSIWGLARRMTENQEDAEDLLQEAFMNAFRSIASFKGKSKFSTWLYRITVNLALMKRRGQKYVFESLDAAIATEDGEVRRDVGDESHDPLALVIVKESREVLDKAMAELYPHNRAVFVLRHVEGLSTEETGEVLNISTTAVKSRLHRTRLTLQERLLTLAREEALATCVP
jgi:RNA polymerase sigma-70 factor (ECF subfamily)